MLRRFIAFMAVWLVAQLDSPALAAGRVALLIGNGAYQQGALTNPTRDVAALKAAFDKAGFDVVEARVDLDRKGMLQALDAFEARARNADVALVYYSGHGIEIGGTNYLVPVDAQLQSDRDVKYEALALDDILTATEGATKLKLIILDACRDNPFAGAMRRIQTRSTVARGLARTEAATPNTIIAYATAPGRVALDGTGSNSPFATALVRHLLTPGLDVRLALGLVRDDVIEATRTSPEPQTPYVSGTVGGAAVSVAPAAGETAKPDAEVTGNRPKPDPERMAREDFDRARSIKSLPAWDAFLRHYPTGLLADLARAEREKLAAVDRAPKPVRPAAAPKPSAPARVVALREPRTVTRSVEATSRSDRPDPTMYSRSVWGKHTLQGQPATTKTAHGTLYCLPGRGQGRQCRWLD
ncbi:caspase family protein [Prosthecodimorpha staleyi]|uniref:Caspase family protein n=1 Tax=Prosthecodimorpha staleyi TaxID=2840188 RepID=A0A947D282_9HYPH|nr:caspase family protein [Prosthecodimorpha staleyi]MBT9289435.1 caspase family protein [Prosthecodimorpha staleyi]